MTRLAILSDIHGNWPALEAVIADMALFEVDRVVMAGDAIHRGPDSARVAAHVIREGWTAIRGNNEYYLLDLNTPRAPESWNREPLLQWLAADLAGDVHHQIAGWPDTISLRFPDGPPIRVIHGQPGDVRGFIHAAWPDDESLAHILRDVEEPFIIGGHTHLSLDRTVGRWRIFNPGAVGMPFDGIKQASYLLLESTGDSWKPTFRRVCFDYDTLFAAYDRTRFVERFGVTARLILEEVRQARPFYKAFNDWMADHHPGEPRTVPLFEAFIGGDWWPYQIAEYQINQEVEQPCP